MHLRFSDALDNTGYFLLELPEEAALQDMVIKAPSENEPAVLCSAGKTFSLRHVMSSNSLFITKEDQVISNKDSFIECILCLPKTDRLSQLLPLYDGTWKEHAISCTLAYLNQHIPASLTEIEEALVQMHAFEWQGEYYQFDMPYAKYLFQVLMASLMAEGKEETFSLPEAYSLVREEDNGLPLSGVKALVDTFCDYAPLTDLYTLVPKKVGCFMAEFIFKTIKTSWVLTEFLQEWSEAIPNSMEIDLSMLQGIAIMDEDTVQDTKMIRYFPKSKVMILSNGDVRSRFDLLFAMKRKWNHEELSAYISDLGVGKELDAVLLKYTRNSKKDGSIQYTNRFPMSTKMLELVSLF